MNKVLVVTGPSGVGKTFLAQQLLSRFPTKFQEVKIHTTRQPRDGEIQTDRIFVSHEEFERKRLAGDFLIAERFHNSSYGYEKSSFTANGKHIIVNAWPDLLPKFEIFPDKLIVGLTIRPDDIGLLKKRMLQRGDSAQKVAERLLIVSKDLSDMTKYKDLIEHNGKLFSVTDDTTINKSVIPWLEKSLDIG